LTRDVPNSKVAGLKVLVRSAGYKVTDGNVQGKRNDFVSHPGATRGKVGGVQEGDY
jgi:hypothetical protein